MHDKLYPSDFKCDYHGWCRCLPLVEVYSETSWSYLCLFHFISERVWKCNELGYCLADWLTHLRPVLFIWNAWCKRSWRKERPKYLTNQKSIEYVPLR